MKEDWSKFSGEGWRWNSELIKDFAVPKWEFNRFRNRVKKSDPEFYRENVFKDENNRLLLSPIMVNRMKGFYPGKFEFRDSIKRSCEAAKVGLENAKKDILETFKRINGVDMKVEKDVEFNDVELEIVLGFVEKELDLVKVKMDALADKEANLMEFKDKVLFKLGR